MDKDLACLGFVELSASAEEVGSANRVVGGRPLSTDRPCARAQGGRDLSGGGQGGGLAAPLCPEASPVTDGASRIPPPSPSATEPTNNNNTSVQGGPAAPDHSPIFNLLQHMQLQQQHMQQQIDQLRADATSFNSFLHLFSISQYLSAAWRGAARGAARQRAAILQYLSIYLHICKVSCNIS